MAALIRLAPSMARSALFQHQRHMATAATATDPVQKLFVDKVREFKNNNKGLDVAHEKAMQEEMLRLKRVYSIDDEKKMAQLEYKLNPLHDVALHDIDDSKQLRAQIHSGEYQKQLTSRPEPISPVLASIEEPFQDEFHLPRICKPDIELVASENDPNAELAPKAFQLADEPVPDYEFQGEKMTAERLMNEIRVYFGPNMPTIHDEKKPERDTKNFPRMLPSDHPPATRFHIVPESWFQFFYPKTGITGFTTFTFTTGVFLLSKELLVLEPQFLTACAVIPLFSFMVWKFVPGSLKKGHQKFEVMRKSWDDWQHINIEGLGKMQEHYKSQLGKRDLIEEIYAIRRQDTELQIEAEHRRILKSVYDDTVRKLNYLVAVADSQRQIAHKNMVNWVISNAVSSFGPKQESDTLDNCILGLKQLASRNANAI